VNIKRFNGNDFPGDKWVRDILSRVNEIVDYLKLKVTRDRLASDVTSVLSPITTKGDLVVGGTLGVTERLAIGTDGQVLTSDGATAQWESLPAATATQRGLYQAGQAPGTATNDSASAGNVGEYIESTGSNVTSLTSDVTTQAHSYSLPAGDWDVWGFVNVTGSGFDSTTMKVGSVGISKTTATLDEKFYSTLSLHGLHVSGFRHLLSPRRISNASSTTVYLNVSVTNASGTAGTFGAYAPTIYARRVR